MPTRIHVSQDYKQPFEAVHRLISSGAFPDSPYKVLENGIIYDGFYEYELTAQKGESSGSVTHYYDVDGASWFRCLRGNTAQNDDGIWCNFMINVREEYHRQNSVLEYERGIAQTAAERQKADKLAADLLVEAIDLFFPHLKAQSSDVIPIHDDSVYEQILGVALRIELSAEATSGASLPLLCKLYFVKNGNSMKPLPWKSARQYERDILNIVPNDIDRECQFDEAIVERTLTAIGNLAEDPSTNLAGYTWMGEITMPATDEEERQANLKDESDPSLTPNDVRQRRALRKMYVQMDHQSSDLQCQRIDVLYISHIKSQSSVCEYRHEGEPILRAQIGINQALTLRCIACEEEVDLIDRDEISYVIDDEERSFVLDRSLPQFGLTDEQVEEIRTRSHFAEHLMALSCPNGCSRVRCATQLFRVEDRDYCRDCRRPEVVYTDFDGKRYHTPSLVITTDTLKVHSDDALERGELSRCTLCGRVFAEDSLSASGKCKCLCSPAIQKADLDAAKKRYRRYRSMLPYRARLFPGKGGRLCYEDNEVLLFSVGRRFYMYSKLSAGERGYLKRPCRINK